ncbi:MAG: glycoside hydrolase family 127 protein [Bacteroidales bacterium]
MKKKYGFYLSIFLMPFIILSFNLYKKNKDYPIQPVPFTSVKVNDQFWAPRIKKNHEVTIPIALKQCEITGRIKNFKIAGKLEKGSFCSIYPFDDSDIYKIIEGASFSLQTYPDKNLEMDLDTLINYIALAQEPDGYLYTNRTIDPQHTHEWAGNERWKNDPVLSHELYNLGHLYEAAVAHYQATGKRSLLDIAIKSANLVDKDFGPGKLAYYPGHQVIEMGLAKLFRATGDERYLKLAKYFLDIRHGGEEYNQAQKPVTEQDKIVGHAVRATYMYSGMADVAAISGDESYSRPLYKIWNDLISTKYYITGGIGSSGSNEGFSDPYDLPNMMAYCETCASIGLVFWNHRMFLLTGDHKYYDVLERTLYNGLMSGVSLSGDHFFYPNVLESRGQHQRSEWFGCACCPSNICRFLPSIPGYIYAVKNNDLYVNLYMGNTSNIKLNSSNIEINQKTDFPLSGKIEFTFGKGTNNNFTLKLRVPDWVVGQAVPSDLYKMTNNSPSGINLKINGIATEFKIENGYISINKLWTPDDKVEVDFPMEIRKIVAHEKIKADAGKFSLQRGPLMYCIEWPDIKEGKVLNQWINPEQIFTSTYNADLLDGINVIQGKSKPTYYKNDKIETGAEQEFTAIPYYAWANRGPGEMSVWLSSSVDKTRPTPPVTIASESKIKSTDDARGIKAINDFDLPSNSNDHSVMYFHWWPKKDTTEWIEYAFSDFKQISKTSVYWFDDGPDGGCRVPESWRILYEDKNGKWIPVKNTEKYPVLKDKLNTVKFQPVTTKGLRIEIKLPKDYSSGLYEWSVQ